MHPDEMALDFEEAERRFNLVFECQEDRERLFEEHMPETDYKQLALLAYVRQNHIVSNIQKTTDEIKSLRSRISILEMQNDQIRESEF